MAERVEGKAVAAEIIAKVTDGVSRLVAAGAAPGLSIILVGEDPASRGYVASKARVAAECGFVLREHELPEGTAQPELMALVGALNADPSVDGILVQLPLPDGIDASAVIQAVAPEKDVDGLNFINVGKLAAGRRDSALVPCTPAGCMVLIERIRGGDLSGLHAVVIGRSSLVGRPLASLLLAADCTVTMTHSRTRDLARIVRLADVVVAAAGRPHLVKGDWIKPGATIIDVGINRIPAPERGEGRTRIVGDVEYAEAERHAGAITPVPGGVGPMTIAMLMANTLIAACRAAGVAPPSF